MHPIRGAARKVRMKIAIIGAGRMGQTLARLLVRVGYQVKLANSRDPESLAQVIADLGAGVIDALVAQDPFKIGYEGVRAVTEKLDGKSPEKKIDLSATVIAKEDLDKPEIKKLLHPDL